MRPTSFSQNNMFDTCSRHWYYKYIKKIPAIQDMSYAHAGTVIHKIMQNYYNWADNSIDAMKKEFKVLWEKYKLHQGMLKNRSDEYWLMCVTGFNCKQNVTSNELRIIYPDVVAYLDFVDTANDIIGDWKSSKRRTENEEEYTKQVKFYSYLYRLKFSRLPKKAIVYYLRYDGTKGTLEYIPTIKDMFDIEEWHFDIRRKMEEIITKGELPPKVEVCNPWCPYKGLCKGDDNDNVKFKINVVGNYLQLQGLIAPVLNTQLHKKFSYDLKAAYFIKKNNPHAKTTIDFWSESRKLLPIGFKDGLLKTLKDYAEFKKKELVLDFEDTRVFDKTKIKMPDKFVNGKELRDYQLEAVDEFLRKKIGVAEAAPGSGKTELAIEIIRRLGVKTLFLVNRVELLNQTKERIEKCLGIEVGKIGQNICDVRHVTVATIQTLIKNLKVYYKYLASVRLCIFDEAHHTPSTSFWRLSRYLLNTEYRLGLTATNFRDDGNEMYIEAICGKSYVKLSSDFLIKKGWLTRPKVIFVSNFMSKEDIDSKERNAKQGLINETEQYPSFYKEFIVNNQSRNDIIKKIVDDNQGKKILVLVKLIEHGNFLSGMLDTTYLFGDTDKTERIKLMKDFKDGDLNVLVGTSSIFSEGIDVPKLDIIINATANKGDIKSVQMLGRVMRLFEGKDKALYYDFLDEHRFFKTASFARRRIFIEQKHDVQIIKTDRL